MPDRLRPAVQAASENPISEVTSGEWAALQAAHILLAPGEDPGAMFTDGFESGDTSAWSSTVQ